MRTSTPFFKTACLCLISALAPGLAHAAVVFAQIDLTNDTVTLHNNGGTAVDLGGWRFCSHDADQGFRYTDATDLNGQSIAAGSSIVIDMSDAIFSANFATPLDAGNPYSLALYNDLDGSLSFSSSNDLSAFVQFAPAGATNFGQAENRTGTAVAAGLWDAAGSFVRLDPTDTRIVLNDLNTSTGAASFSAIPEPASLTALALSSILLLTRRRR